MSIKNSIVDKQSAFFTIIFVQYAENILHLGEIGHAPREKRIKKTSTRRVIACRRFSSKNTKIFRA